VEMPTRQVQIEDGVLQLHVTEQQLDRAQVGARFQEMGCLRMAQQVRGHALLEVRARRG
jgi:hypothetical protein